MKPQCDLPQQGGKQERQPMQRPPRRRRTRRQRPKGPMRRLLISPDFALLWLKQSVTALCDALFMTTLLIWIGTRTNSPIALGLALVALGVPYALFGPFAEAATERWSRRRTMFVTDVVRGILTFLLCLSLLPVFTPRRALAVIYLLCFFIGVMTRFSAAAQRSALTAVVPPSEHPRGISRIQGSIAILSIFGPILAAICFLSLGQTPLPGLFLTGFLLLLSAGGAQAMDRQFTAKVRAIQIRRRRRAMGADDTTMDDTAGEDVEPAELWSPSVLRSGITEGIKGIRLLLQQRPFASVAIIVALIALVGGILNVLEVFFVGSYLGTPGAYLGLIVGANAAGILLGSVWFGRLDAHLQPTTTFIYATLGMGLATAAFVTSRSLNIALLCTIAMGIANGMALLAAQTTLVETGDRSHLPRLMVGYETQTALAGIVGTLLGGLAGGIINIATFLKVASGLLIAGGVLGWLVITGLSSRLNFRHRIAHEEGDEGEGALQESSEEYEPAEDQDAAFDDGEEEALPMSRRPSQQFGRFWAEDGQDQDDGNLGEDEPPPDEEDAGDAEQWEPPAPVEEPPLPRRTMRLRPAPWEKPGGFGR